MSPIKWKPEFNEMLIQHMADGFSFESFGGVIRVSRTTLNQWANINHEGFGDAKEIGFTVSQFWWEKEGMRGMDKGKDFNATVWIFSMKNRFGWRDQKHIDFNDKTTDKPPVVDLGHLSTLLKRDPFMVIDGDKKSG